MGKHIVIMSGSNLGKTCAAQIARNTSGFGVALPTGDFTLQQIEDAQATPGTARRLHCPVADEVTPAPREAFRGFPRATRSRYRAEAIRNGDLTIVKGTSAGLTMFWAAPEYGVNVCDVCGCVHRSHHGYICNSCFDGMQKVQMQLATDSFVRAADAMGRAFRDAGHALSTCEFYGASPVWDALLTYKNADAPTPFGDFMAGIVDSLADAFDIPRSALLTPTPFPRGNDFSNILRSYGMECPPLVEPVAKRRTRNTGPAARNEWWNKKKKW